MQILQRQTHLMSSKGKYYGAEYYFKSMTGVGWKIQLFARGHAREW